MNGTKRAVEEILRVYIEEEGVEARSIDSYDAVQIVQQVDPRLRRMKRKPLLDIIETVLFKLQPSTPPPPESNEMNQKVVGLWKVDPTESNSENKDVGTAPETSEVRVSETAKPERKKRKKLAKEETAETTESIRKPASNVRLSDLGGIDKIIDQILELLVMPLSHPEIFMTLGSDIPRGILLHGPPGCGKTVLANAIANELGCAFLSISAPAVVSGMSGESEKKLRELFEEAKGCAPCLIFIDEIDAITPKRETAQREMERRIVAQLLTCMDDVSLEKTGGKPIMIIGATNRPDSIDPALRRGGRFDHEICMTVPDQLSRQRILETLAKKLKLEGEFSFAELAKRTPGYVGADLKALVAAAGVSAIKRIFKELANDSGAGGGAVGGIDDVINSGSTDGSGSGSGSGSASGMADMADDNVMASDSLTPKIENLDLNSNSLIRRFLAGHQDPLTDDELAPLAIKFDDFMTALPLVQPSSKREGFATVPDVTWEDIGAMKPIREELEYAIVAPILNPDIYLTAGISAPSGVLLWGPPGCGKTLLAKAVANESKANFISVRGPELLNKYVGESEKAVRQVFVRARASTPCIIFFDELDALVPRRNDSQSEASSRVVNTLLTELDGTGDRNGVFVVAATNRPDMIDSAMLRPGRLDKQLFVELPKATERVEILRTVCRKNKSPLFEDVELSKIGHEPLCRNFSGADLASLAREAAVLALKRSLKNGLAVCIIQEDFLLALQKIRPSVTDSEREKYYALRDVLAS